MSSSSSNSDQQYPQPYGEQPYGQAYGEQAYGDQSYAEQPYGQSYGDQAHADQSYGRPYAGEQPQRYDGQSYGAPAYGDPAHGQPQQPYGDQAAPYDASSPWPTGQSEPGAFDQGATQTWQAPTWDTQYQPTIQPVRQPVQPPAHQQPVQHQVQQPVQPPAHQQPAQHQVQQPVQQHPVQQPVQHPVAAPAPYAADAAYPPPQGASGSYPLPPEVPDTSRTAPASAPAPAAASSAALDASGFSAPTTLGNSRITDAQRARAEGRSPIIAPGMQPAAITAGLGLLLSLGAAIGPYALLVPLVLLQAVTAAGWFRLNGMWPARQGIALAFAGGLAADVALLAAGRENGPGALLGTLGIWVLLTVVLQLRSHAGADERMYGLMATLVSAALAVLAGGHLAAVPDAVTVGGVAVAAAVLVRALPLPGAASAVMALLAAAGAGAVMGGFTDFGAKGAFLGLAAGVCALIGLRVASYDYPSRFVHMTAGVALPLTAAAPAVYLIGRVIG
ncbi:hypothetical protein OHA98_37240 [Streptomyces sp. NBC_00654]|uniref:hypothetical protein n=1 Tax=Streptomyces sp. NBC_00654 TaxID=2975799 RepID=UPI00225300D5|nr:hypothetical protein [Streptomyces sp. NBC_00654]MCX4970310.1 hypothetical protein [Streptomyces sp. NBC_00654]